MIDTLIILLALVAGYSCRIYEERRRERREHAERIKRAQQIHFPLPVQGYGICATCQGIHFHYPYCATLKSEPLSTSTSK